MLSFRTLGIGIAAAALTIAGQATAQSCQAEAGATWTRYRAAIAARDADAAAALTRFPLLLRGDLDDSPSERIGKPAFKARFTDLIAQESGTRDTPYSVAQLAADTPALGSDGVDSPSCDQGGRFDVGPLSFTRETGAWKLSTIYAVE